MLRLLSAEAIIEVPGFRDVKSPERKNSIVGVGR
jgi:hypothetical protein